MFRQFRCSRLELRTYGRRDHLREREGQTRKERFSSKNKDRKLKGVSKMASARQKSAAKKNIKKAASTAKKKRTIAHLPKSVRTALGKQAASAAKKKRKSHNKG